MVDEDDMSTGKLCKMSLQLAEKETTVAESYTWELLRMHVRDVTGDAQRAHSGGLNALQAITTTTADTTRALDKMDVCNI